MHFSYNRPDFIIYPEMNDQDREASVFDFINGLSLIKDRYPFEIQINITGLNNTDSDHIESEAFLDQSDYNLLEWCAVKLDTFDYFVLEITDSDNKLFFGFENDFVLNMVVVRSKSKVKNRSGSIRYPLHHIDFIGLNGGGDLLISGALSDWHVLFNMDNSVTDDYISNIDTTQQISDEIMFKQVMISACTNINITQSENNQNGTMSFSIHKSSAEDQFKELEDFSTTHCRRSRLKNFKWFNKNLLHFKSEHQRILDSGLAKLTEKGMI